MCKINDEDTRANNKKQIKEALGRDNRYFAGQFYGRPMTAHTREVRNLLMIYYIEHGGATGHRERVRAMEGKKAAEEAEKNAAASSTA